MNVYELMDVARELDGSDIHLSVGTPPVIRVSGEMSRMSETDTTAEGTEQAVSELLNGEQRKKLDENGLKE